MPESVYEIAALALRYMIAAVITLITLRVAYTTFAQLRREDAPSAVLGTLKITGWPKNKNGTAPKGRIGTVFSLGRDALIGAAHKCDIRLGHKSVESVHAQIWEKEGVFYLSPVKGRVLVNGKSAQRGTMLPNGCKIAIGAIELEFTPTTGGRHA